MNFYLKNKGPIHAVAWIEVFDQEEIDWRVACEAQLILGPPACLIDTIETKLKYRRKGCASFLIKELKERFDNVAPIGVEDQAVGFWRKMGMEDALGEEE